MIFLVNNTETQSVGVGDTVDAIVFSIHQTEAGYSLNVRVGGVYQPEFDSGTLEQMQALAVSYMGALNA